MHASSARLAFALVFVAASCGRVGGEVQPGEAAAFFDLRAGLGDLANLQRPLLLRGIVWQSGEPLEFTSALQWAETDRQGTAAVARRLKDIRAMSVGGWFQTRRGGEQTFFCRGLPQIAALGERMFRPSDRYVNFCLGADQHGFFLGTINGNGMMPFPYVTLHELYINAWHQLVVVKDADGYQRFYANGTLVRSDRDSAWSPKVWPFREASPDDSEPLRLSMPMGGLIGEAWIFPRELSAAEIEADFRAKRDRYRPAQPAKPVLLREMNSHPAANLWSTPPTAVHWPAERERILSGTMQVLGPFPAEKVPLDPHIASEEDCGTYVRRRVSFAVQPDDRMPAYLLIPKRRAGRLPAVICFYGTTSGAGKETTVGLSGPEKGSPPRKNRAFAIDMVEAGFVAFAGDYLRDGERVKPGERPNDSKDFYRRFPQWSIVGKDAWDNARVCDYLETLDFVDPHKIGMVGHSYGGHSTIFAAALEPRIRVAVSNGPVSEFLDHGTHWGRPLGAAGGEYIRGLRPYVLDPTRPLPVTFYEFTSLIAPRPLLVGQAVGERRPKEEENYAAVSQVYRALGTGDRVRYHWYAGDHDFPPEAREAAVAWFRRWFEVDAQP
jgi:pimeloyl-ACP methyl ester carboxylesterase